ncbi:glutamate formimidoyltransferase [Sulfobacillus harzensis]|uniref:glutamate formimidoyltransferase n=1 Tax=Sulfobacillus harzensis TaxID=2729629 RepID=A0A7Y0Q4F7_9FIRM|nr:glutamate formimidoyltransferase [Sulfobacillus harzensis]NMP23209.1 glutamate formimidoyltransferase [Sulfobacillus harzensis]
MSEPIFECIPNFSEGRRAEVLDALIRAAEGPSVKVLGIHADPDHNRSVLTIAGPGDALFEAVFRTMRVAVDKIDLRQHEGAHPRIGAVDVVPWVALDNQSWDAAVGWATKLGERTADELKLPVFFYEMAARRPDRRNLADVRRSQFEGLETRLAHDPPDLGPVSPHPSAGAVAIGARRPLIAFNVILGTDDAGVARQIARAVRGASGGLAGVKALGFRLISKGRVQVSMNLVNYRTTPLPRALELVRMEAARHGVAVVGTELVGFMPMDAVEDVMRYYLQQPDFDRGRILEVALDQNRRDPDE